MLMNTNENKNWFEGLSESESIAFQWFMNWECTFEDFIDSIEVSYLDFMKEKRYNLIRDYIIFRTECVDKYIERKIKERTTLEEKLNFNGENIFNSNIFKKYLEKKLVSKLGMENIVNVVKIQVNFMRMERWSFDKKYFSILNNRVLVNLDPTLLKSLSDGLKEGFIGNILKNLSPESYKQTILHYENRDELYALYKSHLDYYMNKCLCKDIYIDVLRSYMYETNSMPNTESYLDFSSDEIIQNIRESALNYTKKDVIVDKNMEENTDEVEYVTDEKKRVQEEIREDSKHEILVNKGIIKETKMDITEEKGTKKMMKKNLTKNTVRAIFKNPNLLSKNGYVGNNAEQKFYEDYKEVSIDVISDDINNSKLTTAELKKLYQYMFDMGRTPSGKSKERYIKPDVLIDIMSKCGYGNKFFVEFCDYLRGHYSTRGYLYGEKKDDYLELVFKCFCKDFGLLEFKNEMNSLYPNLNKNIAFEMEDCFINLLKMKKVMFKTDGTTFYYMCRRYLGLKVEHYDYSILDFNKDKTKTKIESNIENNIEVSSSVQEINDILFTQEQIDALDKFVNLGEMPSKVFLSYFMLLCKSKEDKDYICSELEVYRGTKKYNELLNRVSSLLEAYS